MLRWMNAANGDRKFDYAAGDTPRECTPVARGGIKFGAEMPLRVSRNIYDPWGHSFSTARLRDDFGLRSGGKRDLRQCPPLTYWIHNGSIETKREECCPLLDSGATSNSHSNSAPATAVGGATGADRRREIAHRRSLWRRSVGEAGSP